MKTSKLILATLSTVVFALGVMTVMPAQTQPQPVSAAQSDKYDGDCTGTETAGRCADKCPPPSFIRGIDKETGAAICGTVTGCPYGDSIPLGPECDKHIPQEPQPEPVDFGGK